MTRSYVSMIIVAIAASAEGRMALSSSRRPTGLPTPQQPQLILRALRVLRGGADASQQQKHFVVRRAAADGNSSTAPIFVRSLRAFCDEHDLDEEAMVAAASGDAEEHNGWLCEEAREYEAEVVTVEDVQASDEASGEATSDKAAAALVKPAMPPMQMNKMILGFIAPMAVMRVLKRFDQTSANYMLGLRCAFFGVIALNVFVQFLLQWRIRAANDTAMMPAAPPNPLAALMGGSKPPQSKTVAEYDREQLKSLRTSYQFGCLLQLFLHFQMKLTQPMVYSSISSLIDLVYNPLVQIHLLRKPAEGPNKRPFGSGAGLGALLNAGAPAADADSVLGGSAPTAGSASK